MVGLLLSAVCCAPPLPPLIVVISIDTLRPDRLEIYGARRATSPNLTQFRQDSILFENAVSHAPSTLPAHASILTSLVPQHHGASHTWKRPLSTAALTLPEVLKAAGFRTLAVVGGGQLAPEFGLDQGFDIYRVAGRQTFAETARIAWQEFDRAPLAPTFLFLHTYQVHHPYTPAQSSLSQVAPEGGFSLAEAQISVEWLTDLFDGRAAWTARDLERTTLAYDAEIAEMDADVGTFLAELRRRGLYDSALIVFTSDHGEELGEHGKLGWHSHTLYEELLRVPLIVKYPGNRAAGGRDSTLARGIDVAPTVLAASGERIPEEFQGRDLAAPGSAAAAVESFAVLWRETMPGEATVHWGLRGDRFKWAERRLFDLRDDPMEQTDLARGELETARELERRLRQYVARRPPLTAPSIDLDEETRVMLRSLGYLQ